MYMCTCLEYYTSLMLGQHLAPAACQLLTWIPYSHWTKFLRYTEV